ncbi:MAG: DUF485 domain-containing protein [Planctomycetota bacterium]|nr:DUF485 domain-containing protein [Planctomycetota bacterium]
MEDPADSSTPLHPSARIMARNARVGLILFFVYLVLYGGFMLLNAFAPQVMGTPTFVGGANLALVYGVGLIAAALLLALLYMFLCRAVSSDAALDAAAAAPRSESR